ncbi:signal transduction histidine kinase [Kribbella sp. VKM Ac-2568]|nr:signal transduction histidine kinase [Kribbella sp. VKM Ac-2568]
MRADVGLAAALAVFSVVELYFSYAFERVPGHHPSALHLAIAVVAASSLAWRRVFPLVVAPFVAALAALQPYVTAPPNVYGEALVGIIAVYSLAVYAPTLRRAIASAALTTALFYVQGLRDPNDPIGEAVTYALIVLLILGAGALVRGYRDRADEAEHRAQQIAADERARIARELHDVVAHGMSVVVLQARGGRRMLAVEPGTARLAFDDIERVAADCLDEMRRLLGILRSAEPEAAPLAPQPKLYELEALVDQARASGAVVELVVDGKRRDLAPAIELSAYRIAQEALTNALKHAPGSRARLHVSYELDAVAIEVTDDGPGSLNGGDGHGLIGMRERAELFGGSFHAGSEPGGGFGVRARLPVPGTAP